jgi:hypothetical protein
MTRTIVGCFAALALTPGSLAPRAARAAESYDNCTGFITSLPATVSTEGAWCLKQDLSTAIASGNAITISSNNISIDCHDFKLDGNGGAKDNVINGFATAITACSDDGGNSVHP